LDAARAELFKQTLQARGGFIQTVFHKELPVQDAAMHDALICGWAQRMAGKENGEILQVLLEEGRAAKSWSPTLRARVAEILSLKPVAGE
ncbi:MAG TPA: hypothetical protein VHM91_04595, partial [Verrucomicrobiales bacterium]|nr:hypothetical protein [Verrucomicrobiales bacterium]